MQTEFDPYVILGVARDCSADELKSAYRRLARDNHPDVARDKNVATVRMTQINAAWSQVGDPQKRAAFDARVRLDERERARAAAIRFAREHSANAAKPPASQSKSPSSPPQTPTKRGPSPASAPTSSSASAPRRSATSSSSSSAGSRHARLAEASRLLFKQNKPNEALEVCKSILKTDFRNIPARELMGEAYLRLGQTDRALAVWEQALVLSPSNVTLRRRWLSLMSPEARAALERKAGNASQGARATPVATNLTRAAAKPASNAAPNLLSRLVSKLKRR